MSDKYTTIEQAQKICRNLLDLDPPTTQDKIKDAVSKVGQILPSLENSDKEKIIDRLISVTGTSQDAPRILDDDEFAPWIRNKWSKRTERNFWKRYQTYLTDEKKFAPKIISRLDELTDNILDRLADPDAYNEFDKRGLVVGHVQSGKTSNYIGLITKAADAGYKLIVVFAGIHNSLRSQTQLRIDEGFLGYDTETSRSFTQGTNHIGVGLIEPDVSAHSLTSSALNGDFRKSAKDITNTNLRGTDPVVVVVKKNNSVLKNLIEWFSAKAGKNQVGGKRIIEDIPLLLIDDEADNASINISKSGVSAINGSIRALLQLFRKSAYVGYTATPYANVFIPAPKNIEEPNKGIKIIVGEQDYPVGEDLFPRNFIINIPPPSNYIGPEKTFGIVREDRIYEQADENEGDSANDPIWLYNLINDYQPTDYSDSRSVADRIREENSHFIPDRHKKDDNKPESLPESMKTAIKYFILACAARRVRGQINVHNSMLIHVTRFVDWQNHIALLVGEELAVYKRKIEFRQSDFVAEMKSIWEEEFIPKTKEIVKHPGIQDPDITFISWLEVESQLLPAAIKVQLRAVHGSKLLGGLEPENIQPLDYYDYRKKGLSVIVVGGNKLSRGMTLEGLTVSYYLRASKMYDTLMQMGRWFGYRPGYLDLCRLFTSSELVSHYKHITVATEEMRAEFDRMTYQRKKPLDYGLMVRAHTGVLTITATNKFRYKKMMSFSFSGNLEETWRFPKSDNKLFDHNQNLTKRFIKRLGEPGGAANSNVSLRNQQLVWRGKDNYIEVLNYLDSYKCIQDSWYPKLLIGYIKAQVKKKKLTDWTIALIDNSKAAKGQKEVYYANVETGLSTRKDTSENGNTYDVAKAHIIGSFHEYIDLTDSQLEKAFSETEEDKRKIGKDTATKHPSPFRIKMNRSDTNGLLLIYPLNPSPNVEADPYSEVPIIGLAVSFPYIEGDEKVEYAVNEVFDRKLDYPVEFDEEELAGEESTDEEESIAPVISRSVNVQDNFLELIERTQSPDMHLDETEFSSGIVPSYPHPNDSQQEIRNHRNLVLPASETLYLKENSLPYYSEEEIQSYYLDETSESIIINTDPNDIVEGECIIGLKQSKYVLFSYSNRRAAFSDSCWVIHTHRLNTKYLIAVYNSTLFGAWVRIKGKQKKDTYYIENEVLKSFPLLVPDDKDIWLFENIYELLVAVGKPERAGGAGMMKSYYSNILDAMIFAVYISRTMKQESEILFNELQQMVPLQLPSGDELTKLAQDLFEKLYDKNSKVRKTLFYLENQNKVSRIKAVFTQ